MRGCRTPGSARATDSANSAPVQGARRERLAQLPQSFPFIGPRSVIDGDMEVSQAWSGVAVLSPASKAVPEIAAPGRLLVTSISPAPASA